MSVNVADGENDNRFVDRQDELDELCRMADLVAKKRRPGYAFIYGNSGIGKTTVIDRFLEMQRSERKNDVRILRIEVLEGIESPFYPFLDAVNIFVKENPDMTQTVMQIASVIIECIPGVGQNVKNVLDTIENVRNPLDMERYGTDQGAVFLRYSQRGRACEVILNLAHLN